MNYSKKLNLFLLIPFFCLSLPSKVALAKSSSTNSKYSKKIAFNENKREDVNEEDLINIRRNPANKTKGRKKVLSIIFENELIKGKAQNPDLLSILNSDSGPNAKRIIKLRNNFLPEMRQTAKKIF